MPVVKRKSMISGRAYGGGISLKTARGASIMANYLKKRKQAISLGRNVRRKVDAIYKMIETKEATANVSPNTSLPHNNVYIALPLLTNLANGTGDPMNGFGNRIGDAICVKGISIRGFFENALDRARVHYRVMVIKTAKGDTIDRDKLYKGCAGNKMIDQINTERYTVIAQKSFTINCSNYPPSQVGATGIPTAVQSSIAMASGIGTRTFKMWIPGYKFGRGGNVQFENASTQPKFYDYRVVIVAYDWYGTPQDVNNVGKINEMYQKTYFKDA